MKNTIFKFTAYILIPCIISLTVFQARAHAAPYWEEEEKEQLYQDDIKKEQELKQRYKQIKDEDEEEREKIIRAIFAVLGVSAAATAVFLVQRRARLKAEALRQKTMQNVSIVSDIAFDPTMGKWWEIISEVKSKENNKGNGFAKNEVTNKVSDKPVPQHEIFYYNKTLRTVYKMVNGIDLFTYSKGTWVPYQLEQGQHYMDFFKGVDKVGSNKLDELLRSIEQEKSTRAFVLTPPERTKNIPTGQTAEELGLKFKPMPDFVDDKSRPTLFDQTQTILDSIHEGITKVETKKAAEPVALTPPERTKGVPTGRAAKELGLNFKPLQVLPVYYISKMSPEEFARLDWTEYLKETEPEFVPGAMLNRIDLLRKQFITLPKAKELVLISPQEFMTINYYIFKRWTEDLLRQWHSINKDTKAFDAFFNNNKVILQLYTKSQQAIYKRMVQDYKEMVQSYREMVGDFADSKKITDTIRSTLIDFPRSHIQARIERHFRYVLVKWFKTIEQDLVTYSPKKLSDYIKARLYTGKNNLPEFFKYEFIQIPLLAEFVDKQSIDLLIDSVRNAGLETIKMTFINEFKGLDKEKMSEAMTDEFLSGMDIKYKKIIKNALTKNIQSNKCKESLNSITTSMEAVVNLQ